MITVGQVSGGVVLIPDAFDGCIYVDSNNRRAFLGIGMDSQFRSVPTIRGGRPDGFLDYLLIDTIGVYGSGTTAGSSSVNNAGKVVVTNPATDKIPESLMPIEGFIPVEKSDEEAEEYSNNNPTHFVWVAKN
jgi:hypothetical protein